MMIIQNGISQPPAVRTGLTGIAGLRVLDKQMDRLMAGFKKDPAIQQEVQYFKEHAAEATSAEKLTKNPRLFRFALAAYGLESQSNAQALMKKVLAGGILDPLSAANRMSDQKFKDMTKELAYGESIEGNLKDSTFVDKLVDKWVSQKFEEAVGAGDDPALRTALYLKRKAPTIMTWYQVMGDRSLYEGITKALGLPIGAKMDVARMKDVLEAKMPVKDFQDPAKVARLIDRVVATTSAPAAVSTANNPALAILTGGMSGGGYGYGMVDLSGLFQITQGR
jgi:hypothetical protein